MRSRRVIRRHWSRARHPHQTAAWPLCRPRRLATAAEETYPTLAAPGVIGPPTKDAPPRQDESRSALESMSSPRRTTWLLDGAGVGRGKKDQGATEADPGFSRRQPASRPGGGGVVPLEPWRVEVGRPHPFPGLADPLEDNGLVLPTLFFFM